MDIEIKELITEIGENYRASAAAVKAHDKQISDIKSRLDLLSFGGGPAAATGRKLWLPTDTEYKAQSIGGSAGLGSYLVPEINAGVFVAEVTPLSVMLAAGTRQYNMRTDRELVPRITGNATVLNAGEGGTITASDVQFGTVALQARTFAIRTIGSSEWFADASDARGIVQAHHQRQLAREIDAQMLEGSGASNELMGLRNWSGITDTVLGSGSGAVPDLDDVLDAISRLEEDDHRATAIFMAPRTWATLRKERDSANNRYQLQTQPTEETKRSLFGTPVYVSSQISTTEAPGGGDSSWFAVCDLDYVLIGVRNRIEVLYDPFSNSSTNQIAIRTTSRWAFAVLDPTAVQVVSGCQPN